MKIQLKDKNQYKNRVNNRSGYNDNVFKLLNRSWEAGVHSRRNRINFFIQKNVGQQRPKVF